MTEFSIEMQELHCHACGMYVQFPIDLSLNGNHELSCPNCGHIHYRVVKDGIITEERYRSSSGPIYQISQYQVTCSSTATSNLIYYTSSSVTTSDLWCRASAITGG